MELKTIKSFIQISQAEIHSFVKFIDDYIVNDHEIPMFINLNFDYTYLIEKHFQVIIYLKELKDLIQNKNDNFEVELNQLLILKLIIDNLIKNHSEYNIKKFESFFNKSNENYYSKGGFLKNHPQIRRKKLALINHLYKVLIKNERLDNTDNQRVAFISLFFQDKKTKSKVQWHNKLYDLRAFLITINDEKLIEIENQSVDDFAPQYFESLTKENEFREFNKNYIKSLQLKPLFSDAIDFWHPIIKNLSAKL